MIHLCLLNGRNLDILLLFLVFRQPEESYTATESNHLHFHVKADLAGLKPEDIGFEILFTTKDAKGRMHINEIAGYEFTGMEDNLACYTASVMPETTGAYDMAIRMFPRHKDLPHRQDFPIVRWL